jgi:hypothetical protein
MFLPRIMLERYGWAGFLVFMIPNVIGCAGLGYVLRTPERARAIIERHRPWALGFSFVTVAYHAFFAVYLATRLMPADIAAGGGDPATTAGTGVPLAIAIVLGLGVVGGLLSRLGDRGWLLLSALTWTISVVVFIVLLNGPSRLGDVPLVLSGFELATLAPVTALGFLLCPYLDLTFLRAHRASAGTHAFGVFGLTFAVMLLVTCVLWFAAPPVLGVWALLHLGVQGCFTVGAHMRELTEHARGSVAARAGWLAGPFVLGLGFAVAAAAGAGIGELVVGEDTYMRFLAAYGLFFPAVVLVLVARPLALPTTRRSVIGLLIACGLLAPLYELGFIGRVPGVTLAGIVAAAAFVIVRRRSLASTAAGPDGRASTATIGGP